MMNVFCSEHRTCCLWYIAVIYSCDVSRAGNRILNIKFSLSLSRAGAWAHPGPTGFQHSHIPFIWGFTVEIHIEGPTGVQYWDVPSAGPNQCTSLMQILALFWKTREPDSNLCFTSRSGWRHAAGYPCTWKQHQSPMCAFHCSSRPLYALVV